MKSKDTGKYHYQILPSGHNDWIIAFVATDSKDSLANKKGQFKVVGAEKQNDFVPTNFLESSTYIDPKDWDPHNNDDHKLLLTNPEKMADSGEMTSNGKYVMGVCSLNIRPIDNDESEFLPDWYLKETGVKQIYYLYYDSKMRKYYWLVPRKYNNELYMEQSVVNGPHIFHSNVKDDAELDFDTGIQYVALKGPLYSKGVVGPSGA